MSSDVGRPLAAILTVNTVANMMGAAVVGAQADELWGDRTMVIVSGLLTVAILVVGEIIPKTMGTRFAPRLAGVTALSIRIMTIATYPVVVVLERVAKMVGGGQASRTTREDVLAFAKLGHADGALDDDDALMIRNEMELERTPVSDILIPWEEIVKVSADMTVRELMTPGDTKTFTRMPIFEPASGELTGFVHLPEICEEMRHQRLDRRLGEIAVPLRSVPDDRPLDEAFSGEEMLVIKDKANKTIGIATMDDALRFLYTHRIEESS
jgi:CBS domain containing-hemolysin-like protein